MDIEKNFIVSHEFQVTKPNGDIDFIAVYDLTFNVARKFAASKYPNCTIEFYQTVSNPNPTNQ